MHKVALRKELLARRQTMPDREWRSELLQRVMRVWLIERPDTVIGAYWPIKGEFDPLPSLHRWKEDGELLDQPQRRRIGLPVVDKVHKRQGAEGVRALFGHPRMQPALQAAVGSSIDAKICDGVANMMLLMKAKRGGQIKHHERMRSILLHACCGRLERGDALPTARRLGCSRNQVAQAVRKARAMHAGSIPLNAASRRISKRRVTAAQVYTAISAWMEASYPSPGRNSVRQYPQPALVAEVTGVQVCSQQSTRFHHESGNAIWRDYRDLYGTQALGFSLFLRCKPKSVKRFKMQDRVVCACLNCFSLRKAVECAALNKLGFLQFASAMAALPCMHAHSRGCARAAVSTLRMMMHMLTCCPMRALAFACPCNCISSSAAMMP
jgi:hypothetical protein